MRDHAIESDGKIAPDQVEELGRLARLAEICDAAEGQRKARWPLAAALGITLVIVSGLLFARVANTEIELDIAVSELSFVVPSEQVLTKLVNLTALGVSGLRDVGLPTMVEPGSRGGLYSRPNNAAIRLSVASDDDHEGTITLATIVVPEGTRIDLKRTEVPHQYRLAIAGEGLALRLDMMGDVLIGPPDAPAERASFGRPRSLRMESAGDEVSLDLTLPGASDSLFSPNLPVMNLAFSRIDEFAGPQRTIIRRVSTILSGTMYFESLNGEAYHFRHGEVLHFAEARGEIRKLFLDEDHIAVEFHGQVRGMGSGSPENPRSFMPTYLEWLRARHGLSLLWGTTLYVLGLIVGVFHWWRRPL